MSRAPLGLGARLEQLLYLLLPFWQGIIGLGLLAALFRWISGQVPLWGGGPTWQLLFFYLLAFGGTTWAASPPAPGPVPWAGCSVSHGPGLTVDTSNAPLGAAAGRA